jgi:thiol:disulfide interchange protein DsbC
MLRYLIAICIMICLPSPRAVADSEAVWLKSVPLHQAIRIGTGKKVVVEVSDPDCRFSRQMVRYWDMRQDVTRYVFLIALKNHPEAADKARYILCAADREAAYREVYAGNLDFGEKERERHCDDHGLLDKHREFAAKMGVISTPTYFVKGVKISGAKVSEIEQILGGEKFPFDASDLE